MAQDSILVVEDSDDDLFFLEKAYGRAGLRQPMLVARDGAEAVAIYTQRERNGEPPALVLLDLKLPKLGGHEVLQAIRGADPQRKTIVICLTGSHEPHDRKRAYECGANGYLLKPSSMDEVERLFRGIKGFWLEHNVTLRSALVPRVSDS